MARITLSSVFALAAMSFWQVATGSPARRDLTQYTAQQIIDELGLTAWESGYSKEAYSSYFVIEDPLDDAPNGQKSRHISSAMYYLLEGSAGWSDIHCFDSETVWHYYGGAPITVNATSDPHNPSQTLALLGSDIFNGQQLLTPVNGFACHTLKSQGDWSLVGITCKLSAAAVETARPRAHGLFSTDLAMCSCARLRGVLRR